MLSLPLLITQIYAQRTDADTLAEKTELMIEFQEMLKLMMDKGLVIAQEECRGITLGDEGLSIMDQLRAEGRVEVQAVKGGTVCW